jgi:penicillin-binding protein 1A
VQAAGKTGTTNSYKDAWFNGYTGNFVAAVWFGNDDSSSMRNMTGGSLPARTWREVMEFAHQGVELKNPFGVGAPLRDATPVASIPQAGHAVMGRPQKPETLSRRSAETLAGIESLMRTGAASLNAGEAYTSSIGAPSARSSVQLGPAKGLVR